MADEKTLVIVYETLFIYFIIRLSANVTELITKALPFSLINSNVASIVTRKVCIMIMLRYCVKY
jgi:hypothetical protein